MPEMELALHHAREAGDRALEAQSLRRLLTSLLHGPTPAEEALARMDVLRSETHPSPQVEVDFMSVRGHLEAMRGRFDIGRDCISRATELVEELGLDYALAALAERRGDLELLAGDAAAAEGWLRSACESLERRGAWGHLATVAPVLADAVLQQGRDDEALQLAELAERNCAPEDAEAGPKWRFMRARVLARLGDLSEAERLAREATSQAVLADYLDVRARAYSALGEVLDLAGKATEAATSYERAIWLFEEKGNVVAAAKLRGLTESRPV
jgi:tetratricopeptide (TPR) repeat protein